MSVSINKVMIAGNMTRDPETKFLANDRAVASFSLACNRKYRKANGEQDEECTFVDCEAWGRTAELVGQYCQKGKPVFVEGRLKLDTWEDQQGNKRSRLKVVADQVQFLPSGERKQKSQPDEDSPPRAASYSQDDGNEPPF